MWRWGLFGGVAMVAMGGCGYGVFGLPQKEQISTGLM